MNKKKLNKTVWYSSELDVNKKPILPPIADSPTDLDGLHEGEIFLHNSDEDPSIWIRTSSGKIQRLKGTGENVSFWELMTDESGNKYIFTKYHLVTQFGMTMYSGDDGLNLPSIYDGLPIDSKTIYWEAIRNDNGVVIGKVLKAQGGGGTGGGVADSVSWSNVYGKPTWLLDDKINYSEIEGIPNLSVYQLKITSDNKLDYSLIGNTPDLSVYQSKITSSNKLAYSLISGTPDLSVYALKENIPSLSGYATEQWVKDRGYATTDDLDSRINSLIDGAPAAYDTLNEIADVLSGNVNSIGDIITTLGTKANQSALDETNKTVKTKWTQDDTKISNWDTAFGWGNHANAGYYLAKNFTKENIKSKLGISDWALMPTKPSYKTSEVKEETNLYFTKERAIDALSETLKNYLPLTGGTISGSLTVEQDLIANRVIVNGITLKKSKDGVLYIDGNLVVRGGVTMYGDESANIPSILNSIPTAGYDKFLSRGLAAFNSKHFVINDGVVSIISGGSGLNEEQLESYLKKNGYVNSLYGYALESWVLNQGYATQSSFNELSAVVEAKWTTNETKINQWDTAYSWGNHANAGYAKKSDIEGKYVTIAGDEDITGIHNFTNGFKVGGNRIYESKDGVIYIDANVVLKGGLTMYGLDSSDVPSIIESLPIAGTTVNSKGIAYFDGTQFTVSNGKVTIKDGAVGTDISEVENLLAQKGYATEQWVISQNYLPKSSYTASDILSKLKTVDGTGSGLDADMLDGYNGSSFLIAEGKETSNINSTFGYTTNRPFIARLDSSSQTNYPTGDGGYGNIVHFGVPTKDTAFQLYSAYNTHRLLYRMGTWHSDGSGTVHREAWKTIAFTDSNVASATKLNDDSAFTIWGQTFFVGGKPKSVDGAMTVNGNATFNGNVSATEVSVNGITLKKSKDGILYLDGNLVVKGGVTMYGTDSSSVPSILDSLPVASTSAKGIAQFNSTYFSVSNGVVSIKDGSVGLNESELNEILNGKGYLVSSDLGALAFKSNLLAADIPSLDWSKITSGKPTTLSGYGITDAKVDNGVITLGGNSITPLTSVTWGNIVGRPTNLSSFTDDIVKGNYLPLAKNVTSGQWKITPSDGYIRIAREGNTDSELLIGQNSSGHVVMGQQNLTGSTSIKHLTIRNSIGYAQLVSILDTNLQGRVMIDGDSGQAYMVVDKTLSDGGNRMAGLFTSNKSENRGGVAIGVRYNGLKTIYPPDNWSIPSKGANSVAIHGDIVTRTYQTSYSNEYYAWIKYMPNSNTLDIRAITDSQSSDYSTPIQIGDVQINGKSVYHKGNLTKLSQLTDDIVSGNYLPLSGGTINGNLDVTNNLNVGGNLQGGYFGLFSSASNPYLKLTFSGANWYVQVYNNYLYLGNGVSKSVRIDSSGNLLTGGGVTMYSQRSLKNIIDERGLSLEELSSIKPTRYTWKDGRDSNIHFGGIADDIQQVLPEVVYNTKEGVLTMDYGNAGFAIASSLINPVVDHEQRIKALEKENELLKQELNRLRA